MAIFALPKKRKISVDLMFQKWHFPFLSAFPEGIFQGFGRPFPFFGDGLDGVEYCLIFGHLGCSLGLFFVLIDQVNEGFGQVVVDMPEAMMRETAYFTAREHSVQRRVHRVH